MDKEQQKKLLTEIVETNQKNGLYEGYIGDTNKMVTAVEWLEEQLKKQGFLYDLDIEAAKQMEKEQIISAHKEGNKYNGWALRHEHEKYYNETYKNK